MLYGFMETSYGLWKKPCQGFILACQWISLVAQTVKCLPTMWDTRVQSLRWEDLLEKEMTPHSSILAWEISWAEELRAAVHGVAKSWIRLSDSAHTLKSKL